MSRAEELFLKYRPIAKRIAGGFKRKLPKNVLYEDLEAAAFLGLWQAVNSDPDREGWEWYVRVRVRGAVIDELRTQDWLPRRARKAGALAPAIVRLDEIAFHEHSLIVANDVPPDEHLEALEWVRERRASFEDLPDRLKIIVQRVASGALQREIASELGISEPRVSQLQSRAIALLRGAPKKKICRPVASTPPPPADTHCLRDDLQALGAVWEALCQGTWRISRLYATERVFGLEIRRHSGSVLGPRERRALEHWLAIGHAKVIGSELRISRASLSRLLTETLSQIGVLCATKRVPVIVSLAAQSPRSQASIEHLASPCLVEVTRPEAVLAGLSRAERDVARHLLDGADTSEIALLRSSSQRTIVRQTHDIFLHLKVSGVNELRAVVARSLLDLALGPAIAAHCSDAAPTR